MRGDLGEAELAFRRAHDLGYDPQPGLALLQTERGDTAAAIRGLQRALEDRNSALQQRRGLLLAALVVAYAGNREIDRARDARAEIEQCPELWASEFTNAAGARARAELAVAEDNLREAVAAMRAAAGSWRAARAELCQALARLRLGELLALEGDADAAALELDAAESAFTRLGAGQRAVQCARLRKSIA